MDGYLPVMTNQLDYNPRCQRRDLTNAAASRFTLQSLYDLLLGNHSHTIGEFQDELQGPYGTLRMHGAGHYSMGGDGSDVFSSLNDPAFYQHHAMLDRVYWIWQALHPQIANTINGTRTFRDTPPSANTMVDDPMDVGALGKHLPIKSMFNTLGNSPLCYIYA
jgi:tyrosinase